MYNGYEKVVAAVLKVVAAVLKVVATVLKSSCSSSKK